VIDASIEPGDIVTAEGNQPIVIKRAVKSDKFPHGYYLDQPRYCYRS